MIDKIRDTAAPIVAPLKFTPAGIILPAALAIALICSYFGDFTAWLIGVYSGARVIHALQRISSRLVEVNLTDICVTILLVMASVSQIGSAYPANGTEPLLMLATGVAFYHCVRGICWSLLAAPLFCALLAALGFALGAIAIAHSISIIDLAYVHHIGDPSSIRYLIPSPLPGFVNGEVVIVLLLVIPYPLSRLMDTELNLLKVAGYGMAVISITTALLLSFLRSSYWSLCLVVCAELWLARRYPGKRLRRYVQNIGPFFIAGVIVACLYWIPFANTMLGDATISQARSISGRLHIWGMTINLIRSHPIWGVGPGTFPVLYPQYGLFASDRPFVSRPFNLLFDYSVSYGVPAALLGLWLIGRLLYRAFRFIWTSSQDRLHHLRTTLMVSLGAGICHECVYSSLLLSYPAIMLFAVALACLATIADNPLERIGT